MADEMLEDMAGGKPGDSRKKVLVILAGGAVLICLLIVAAILIWPYASMAMLAHEVELQFAGSTAVTDEQLAQTKSVLQERFKEHGSNVAVSIARDEQGNGSVLIRYCYLPEDYVVSLATVPGVFEMRVQTGDNQSNHILFGDDIASAGSLMAVPPAGDNSCWSASLELTPSGGQKFRNACLEAGATEDPMNHSIMIMLDGNTFHSAPMSSGLVNQVRTTPPEYLMLLTGTGDTGKATAEKLIAILNGGVLPVPLEVVRTTQ